MRIPTRNLMNKRRRRQSLRFTPYAWTKLVYLRDAGDSEVGMFGLSPPDDLLLIEDIALVRQRCTRVTFEFDDTAVADYFDSQVDQGRRPEEFLRHWLHTHPGDSARPSVTDEQTFGRVFGSSEWATMFILARGGATYCRLCFNSGSRSSRPLRVVVDYRRPCPAANLAAWRAGYKAAVRVITPPPKWAGVGPSKSSLNEVWEGR